MQIRPVYRGGKSALFKMSSPYKGLNLRDRNLSVEEAVKMDNYYPADNHVELRKGYVSYVSLSHPVETLIEYKHPSGNRFLAFSGGSVFDVTNPKNVIDMKKKYHSSRFCCVLFKERLYCVNGQNKIQVFQIKNGNPVMEDADFTGVESVVFSNVAVAKKRLFFVEKNSQNVWYSSSVGEVQGQLVKLDFSTIFRKGGHLVAVSSWTQDGGQGIDDLTVFLSSEGEVLVYAGSNPSDAKEWFLKGSYFMPPPIGNRCLLEYQGDLIVLTQSGFLPMSEALPMNEANVSLISFSDRIRSSLLEVTRNNNQRQGWQGVLYPRGGFALFNIPTSRQFEQYVVNTHTGAWCRFKDIYSLCWGLFQDRLYFGSYKGIFLFDEGYSDNGQEICGTIEQAESSLGTNRLKRLQMLNLKTTSFAPFSLKIKIKTEHSSGEEKFFSKIGYLARTAWGSSWGSPWCSFSTESRTQWLPISVMGTNVSFRIETKTKGNFIVWEEMAVRYQTGEGLL